MGISEGYAGHYLVLRPKIGVYAVNHMPKTGKIKGLLDSRLRGDDNKVSFRRPAFRVRTNYTETL